MSLDVRHLTTCSHTEVASSRHQLASYQGGGSNATDSHCDKAALQTTVCGSQPASSSFAITQDRAIINGRKGAAAARIVQQTHLEQAKACNAGHENRVASCNGCESIAGSKHSIKNLKDAVVSMSGTDTFAPLACKVSCVEARPTGCLAEQCNGISSSPVNVTTHANHSSPCAMPGQDGSASACDSNAVVQGTWVLQMQKAHAKTAKDALKALGFLDRRRKALAADRSDAEVALPVTPEGAAFLSTCSQSMAHQQNGALKTVSASAAEIVCSSSQTDLSHEDPKSGMYAETRAGEMSTQQVNIQELERLIAQGLARIERKHVLQRSGRATPGALLLHAVLSALASRGVPATLPPMDGSSSPCVVVPLTCTYRDVTAGTH